jgi:hypothetical protein
MSGLIQYEAKRFIGWNLMSVYFCQNLDEKTNLLNWLKQLHKNTNYRQLASSSNLTLAESHYCRNSKEIAVVIS